MARESDVSIACALVVAAWLVGLAPVLLGGRTFAGEPHLAGSMPWYDRVATSIAGGHFPEWDDASGLGAAMALEPGRPLAYPPAWLAAAPPRPWCIDALLSAHLLLFGIGAALWSRRLGADPMGAAIAGGAGALSGAATGALVGGGGLCAAAWLPWVGWAADRLAARSRSRRRAVGGALLLAALFGAHWLAAGGAVGPALAAPAVAAAALVARAPARARSWLALAAALAAGLLLSAPAWLPAAAAGRLGAGGFTAGPVFRPADIPALALALWAALAGGAPVRRLAVAGAALALLGLAASADGFAPAAAAIAAALAGAGAARAAAVFERPGRWARWRAAAGALLATAIVGPLAVRAWRTPLEARDRIERPPALLAAAAKGDAPVRPRIAWPDQPYRDDADAPPDTGARFGFAYVPGRDRDRDPLLSRIWRLSLAGAAERLLDLYDVEYAVFPAGAAAPAAMPIAGRSPGGDRVLVENRQRRPRAFVAPRWTWHADQEQLARQLFPAASDQRGSLALAQVRLLGAGPPSPAPRAGPEPALPCAIASARPEDVELTCRSTTGGYAVLLDRAAPGWTAELDGAPAPILTADLVARAVAIGPGLHRLRFVYRTPGLRLGALLAGAAWLNALALALLLYRMRGQPRASVVPIEPG
ncbi:MAG TPA: hypothetical protein VKB80_05500 [Kofleriaceae bacterium]|nr:hypothetical protein [Kofleriaceae bacterium]